MGTTLSCFTIVEKSLIYAHVGDSRLYRYRDKLEQLTEDHSLRHVMKRHIVTRAIGAYPLIHPDIGIIPLFSNDIYMLCSDGLSDYVEMEILSQFLSSSLSLEEMGKKCVSAALKKGGNDNITLLLARITSDEEPNRPPEDLPR